MSRSIRPLFRERWGNGNEVSPQDLMLMGFDQKPARIYQFPVGKNAQTAIETSATVDTGAQLTGFDSGEKSKSASRAFLERGRQNISTEDFKNPAIAPIIARFLMDDCERLESEKAAKETEIRDLRTRHEKKVQECADQAVVIARSQEREHKLTVNEILFFLSSSIGAFGFPIMLTVESLKGGHEIGLYGMGVSALLILGSIILRAWTLFR